jgi:hypothetical protein
MLKNIVNRAVKRREKAVNEEEAAAEGKAKTQHPGCGDFAVQQNVSLQASSIEASTHENVDGDEGDEERGRSKAKSNEKLRSRRSRSSIWQAL